MKQTLGRQVVSTIPVKHTAAATPARAAVASVYCYIGLCGSHPAASVMKPCMRAGAGPCTLVVRDDGIYQRRSRRIG